MIAACAADVGCAAASPGQPWWACATMPWSALFPIFPGVLPHPAPTTEPEAATELQAQCSGVAGVNVRSGESVGSDHAPRNRL